MTKRLLALLMALAMCLSLAACKDSGDTQYGNTDGDPSESLPAESADPSESDGTEIEADLTQTMFEFSSGLKDGDTAVTVNGTAIPNELFFYWLSYDCYYMQYYYSQYGISMDFTDDSAREYLMSDVQNAIAYYACLRQLCQENDVSLTDEQWAEYNSQLEEVIADGYGGDKALLLQSYGLSEDSFEYINTNGYLYTNLAEALVGEPSQDDLEQYVADNGIFGVKHILLKTAVEKEDGTVALSDGSAITNDDGSDYTRTADEYNAAQQALAQQLLDRLQAKDAPDTLFDELMAAYSEDDGLLSYPDGYTFTADDSLVGGFREAALALNEGEMSGLVETDYGYHILLRTPIDPDSYHDDWITQKMDAVLSAATMEAEVTLSEELEALDVQEFYERYLAYGLALYNTLNADN